MLAFNCAARRPERRTSYDSDDYGQHAYLSTGSDDGDSDGSRTPPHSPFYAVACLASPRPPPCRALDDGAAADARELARPPRPTPPSEPPEEPPPSAAFELVLITDESAELKAPYTAELVTSDGTCSSVGLSLSTSSSRAAVDSPASRARSFASTVTRTHSEAFGRELDAGGSSDGARSQSSLAAAPEPASPSEPPARKRALRDAAASFDRSTCASSNSASSARSLTCPAASGGSPTACAAAIRSPATRARGAEGLDELQRRIMATLSALALAVNDGEHLVPARTPLPAANAASAAAFQRSLVLARVAHFAKSTWSAIVVTEAYRPFRIVYVNGAWESLCGYTSEEALGSTCGILHGPLTNRPAARAFTKCVEDTGGPASMIVRNYTKCGEPFLNSIVTLPLREGGGPIQFQAAILTALPFE